MRIGILTFHSQLNYGGVLQCWALQTTLEKMGHEVVVIDREFEHQIRSITAIFKGWTISRWIKVLVKLLLRRPESLRIIRYYRTVRFVQRYLHLTKYSFKEWKDAPKDLGVDLIVVGSDQVWNGIWNDLEVYLLEGAPNIPAIGYAISLGMVALPEQYLKNYKDAAARFSAVSVREDEARRALEAVGIATAHVLDPVLLCEWQTKKTSSGNTLVCYFIDPELSDESMQALKEFSVTTGIKVHIYLQKYSKSIDTGGIKIHYTAGPEEFYKAMSLAGYILSDSFHALAFAAVFSKRVRIVKPSSVNRQRMFSRIQEFVTRYSESTLIAPSVHEALEGLLKIEVQFNEDLLAEDRRLSLNWLQDAIKVIP